MSNTIIMTRIVIVEGGVRCVRGIGNGSRGVVNFAGGEQAGAAALSQGEAVEGAAILKKNLCTAFAERHFDVEGIFPDSAEKAEACFNQRPLAGVGAVFAQNPFAVRISVNLRFSNQRFHFFFPFFSVGDHMLGRVFFHVSMCVGMASEIPARFFQSGNYFFCLFRLPFSVGGIPLRSVAEDTVESREKDCSARAAVGKIGVFCNEFLHNGNKFFAVYFRRMIFGVGRDFSALGDDEFVRHAFALVFRSIYDVVEGK